MLPISKHVNHHLFPNHLGPPIIMLINGSTNSFSTSNNKASVTVLTKDVVLSINLVGEWETPDGSIIPNKNISFPFFMVSNTGLYKFYVTDWHGIQELAIQILITVEGNLSSLYIE